MPRKLDPHSFRPYTYKPSSTSTTPRAPPAPDRTTVNTLLQHLRSSQPPRFLDPTPPAAHTHHHPPPTVPPPLQPLLGATPLPPPPPRPARRRRIPGPPPPASWLLPPAPTPPPTNPSHPPTHLLARLPGIRAHLPPRGSLTDLLLRQLARRWRWHLRREPEYLHYLPARTKELLLAYIAAAGAEVGLYGVAALLAGGDAVRCVDLSHARVGLREVAGVVWGGAGGEVESWEEEEEGDGVRVEELGLAYPRDGGDWEELVRLLERVGAAVRALSLVGWKPPARYGVLRRVVRATLGLKWVEVGAEWREVWEEVEWGGAWRGVEEVVVWGGDEAVRREMEGWIRKVRREEGGREFVRVVEGRVGPEVWGE